MTAPEVIVIQTDAPAGAAFTTRRGGTSAGTFASLNLGVERGDAPEAVRANRALVCEALGVDAVEVRMLHQVHGAAVRRADAADDRGRFLGELRGWPEADALLSETPGQALAVLGADCLPVLLWRRDRPAVAAAHAGWRGLMAGVVERAVAALGEPGRVGAAVGPGIGPCCYPVSAEVRDRFGARFGAGVVAAPAVDLAAAARAALVAAGVPASAVQIVEACTFCERDRFFSYRRDGEASGRQAGIVWATAPAGGRP